LRRLQTFVVLLAGTAAAFQDSQDPAAFLIRITELSIDLSPTGITANDCIAIQSNGQFHLEKRFQQLPVAESKLTVFESKLTKAQLQQLHDLLGMPSLWDLARIRSAKAPFRRNRFQRLRN
jgi:hypothetical protein